MKEKISVEKKKKMLAIIKELKEKISELEKMRKELGPEKKSKAQNVRSLIEEIHVPALEALKEKKHSMD